MSAPINRKSIGLHTDYVGYMGEKMSEREKIIRLIENGKETDCCDFKKCFYDKEKYADMIKDIVAFANNTVADDKYIIFNIDDETHKVGTQKIEKVPDISTINELIRCHVEPYIDVEIGEFAYENSNIVYIKISKGNMDRPYVIKKEKTQNGKCLIKQGDIFIRKNATNFKANRSDLDKIYDMREKRKVVIDSIEIKTKETCVNNVIKEIFILPFIFENSSKSNYLLNNMELRITTSDHSFFVSGSYLFNTEDVLLENVVVLDDTPFSINPYFVEKKIVGFEVSDGHLKKMKEKYGQCVDCNIYLKIKDVNGCEVVSESKACKMLIS